MNEPGDHPTPHDGGQPEESAGRPDGAPTEQFRPVDQAYSATRPFEADPATTSMPYGTGPDGPSPYGAGPYGTESDPAATPTPRRPRRRTAMIASISALALVLVLVIAAVGSELYLRNATEDCLEKSFSDITGSSASVSLSKKPMLLQFATKKVPYVQIDSDGDNGSGIELHGRADDITARSDGSTLGSLEATGSVPFTRIVELSKQSVAQQQQGTQDSGQSGLGGLFGGFTLNQVTGNEASGTMTIDATVTVAIFPIPVSVEIKPVATGGKLEFQVVKASALVFGVPSGFAQTLVDGVSKSLFPPLFDQLDFTKLTVTSTGVDFGVTGTDVPLDQSTLGSTDTGQTQDACTIL